MGTDKLSDTDQIVASGEALSVVSKWLGLRSFQEALAADPSQISAVTEEPRPPLLGLGADPRKYHKAMTAASKLDRKLGQRLKGDVQQSGKVVEVKEVGEDQEDEEEGRAGAIQKRQRPPEQFLQRGKKKKKRNKGP